MFPGFTDSENFTQVPDSFFHHLLTEIDDLDELKVTLFALWRIGAMEGHVHFLRGRDFAACIPDPGPALKKAIQRGSLLRALPRANSRAAQDEDSALYFLNSPVWTGSRRILYTGQVAARSRRFGLSTSGTPEHIQAV